MLPSLPNINSLSIILPCYKPGIDWQATVINSINKLTDINLTELIIVNDGMSTFSANGISEFLEISIPVKIISNTVNMGKGYALRKGVNAAQGALIIYTDIDFPYTEESFRNIYAELLKGADVAIGVRNKDYYTHLPKARIYISKLLRYVIRTFLRIPTDDTQCGLKGFNQNGKKVFLETTIDRYLFDLEFIFLSARKKLKLQTVEVELRPEIVLSKMNWKVLMQEFGNFLKIFAKSIL